MGYSSKDYPHQEQLRIELQNYLGMIVNHQKRFFKGKPFHPLAWFRNCHIHEVVEGQTEQMERKLCINNSIETVLKTPNSTYWEGYYYQHIPTIHAWVGVRGKESIDNTLPIEGRLIYGYFGRPIPMELVLMAADHTAWTISTGVLETIGHFSNTEMKKAKELLDGYFPKLREELYGDIDP